MEFFGKYKGVCFSNDDPEKRGRIRVQCPQVYGEDSPDIWALSVGVPSGSENSVFMLPQKGDAVWVEFEGGDARFPIWSWGWFMEKKMPKATENAEFSMQTKFGKIEINNNELKITKGNSVIKITDSLIEINGATYKAAKGDVVKSQLDTLIDILVSSTDIQGFPFNPVTIAALQSCKALNINVLSQKVKIG